MDIKITRYTKQLSKTFGRCGERETPNPVKGKTLE